MKAIQYTCHETTEAKARESFEFLRKQEGYLGGRVYKSMKLGFDPPNRPWKVQAFVNASESDVPDTVLSRSEHDEMRVVIVPDSQLLTLGIAPPRLDPLTDYLKMATELRRIGKKNLSRDERQGEAVLPDSRIVKPDESTIPFDTTGTFKITLRAVPNPDIDGGWWEGPKEPQILTGSFERILSAGRAYRDGIGGGNWAGGQIYRKEGRRWKLVAVMSYNGRVWPPGPRRSGMKSYL